MALLNAAEEAVCWSAVVQMDKGGDEVAAAESEAEKRKTVIQNWLSKQVESSLSRVARADGRRDRTRG